MTPSTTTRKKRENMKKHKTDTQKPATSRYRGIEKGHKSKQTKKRPTAKKAKNKNQNMKTVKRRQSKHDVAGKKTKQESKKTEEPIANVTQQLQLSWNGHRTTKQADHSTHHTSTRTCQKKRSKKTINTNTKRKKQTERKGAQPVWRVHHVGVGRT